MNKAIIRLEKLIPGSLNIELENYKTGGTIRAYSWQWDQDILRVSIDIAISIFSVPETIKAYEKAYFRIHKDDEEDVLKLATELGYYYDNEVDGTVAVHKYDKKEIVEILEKGRLQKLEEIFADKNIAAALLVQACTIELQKELSSRTVKKVESLIGMPITIEGSEYDDEIE